MTVNWKASGQRLKYNTHLVGKNKLRVTEHRKREGGIGTMGVGMGWQGGLGPLSGFWKFQQKTVAFLVSSRKNEIYPVLAVPKIFLYKMHLWLLPGKIRPTPMIGTLAVRIEELGATQWMGVLQAHVCQDDNVWYYWCVPFCVCVRTFPFRQSASVYSPTR